MRLSDHEMKALLAIERALLRRDPGLAELFVSVELAVVRQDPPTARREAPSAGSTIG